MKRDVVSTFLQALWGAKLDDDRGWILIWDAAFDGKNLLDRMSTGARTAEESAGVVLQRAALADREIYVGVGLRENKPTPQKRGGSKDVIGVPGLWAEFDIAGEGHESSRVYPPDEKAIRKAIKATGLKPTILVHSGHGLQAWWLFKDIWTFKDGVEREKFATLAKNWQGTLQAHLKTDGFEMDSTADLARVLRVAGTVNHKVKGKPAEVKLLLADGPRYDDWTVFEERSISSKEIILPGNSGGPITFDENANPPIEKLEALMKASRKFRLSWERKRTDMKDQSASAYCFSLAYHAAEIGWVDQEIIDLLIAWRRKEHEHLKLDRPEWYCDYNCKHSTIPKVRKAIEERVTAERAIEDLTTGDVEEVDAEQIFDAISRVVGAPVIGFIQHGEEDGVFSFVLANEQKVVMIGNSKQLFDIGHCRARIFEKCGQILPASLTKALWFKVIHRLQQVKNLQNPELGERKQQLKEWVDDYISSVRGIYSDLGEESWNPAVEHRLPFVRYDQGYFYLHGDHFTWWLQKIREIKISRPAIWDYLRHFGFERHTVVGPPTKGYWRFESKMFQEALKVHVGGEFLAEPVEKEVE